MTSLANREPAESIKDRMAEIRTQLPDAADEARARVKQLTDWKYYVSHHPIPVLAAASLAGYLIVPNARTRSRSSREVNSVQALEPSQPAQKGLIAGMAGTLATLLLRQAVSTVLSRVGDRFTYREST